LSRPRASARSEVLRGPRSALLQAELEKHARLVKSSEATLD
jgi:hypothetical protein